MWISDLVYAFAFTTITGTLLTIIWVMLERILERIGYLKLAYLLLRILMFFWVCPVAYIALKKMNARLYRWYGFLFLPTPFLSQVSIAVFVVWVLAGITVITLYIREQIRVQRRLALVKECREERITKVFSDILAEKNIPEGKVQLRMSAFEKTPMVARVIHPVVVLPAGSYEKRELEVIFRHELTHVRHRDVLFKNLAFLICVLNSINPAAWWYLRLLNEWGEYACDAAVCQSMGSLSGYYDIIVRFVQKSMKKFGLESGLLERKSTLRKGVEHARRTYMVKKRSGIMAAIMVLFMLFSGTGTVCAASLKAADGLATVVRRAEIYIRDGKADAMAGCVEPVIVECGEVQVDVHPETLGQSSLCWQIRGHVKMIGPELYLEQGKQLIVSVGDTLTDAGVAVGLIQPNRTSRYVISGNAITHTFRIEQSGIYRVFVLNRGKEVAKVEGEYGLR